MKRSEMIELIWTYIQKVESNYDEYMEKENCEELLSLMEKLGMLPPISEHTSEEITPFGTTYYAIPEWENENEQK